MINRMKRHEFWAETYRLEKRRKRQFDLALFLLLLAIIGILGIVLH